MSTFKCKMCGGTLEIQSGSTVAECEYCGAKQTLPKLDDEKRANLYDRANHFRRSNEFDKASAIYEQILAEDNTDAEAYWSLVLCRYGIEYVEDPLSHRRVPTVHRAQFTSIFDDDNYKSALKNSDTYQRVIYEEEAKAINEIQKGILAISQKEEPFDVFICYKETGDSGKRTHDSVLAQDLYYQLKQEGFKVFFARITLEDKLGSAYEPYIFAALNSAKVMVVLGTKPEFFNAVWVKNEWSRFLSLIKHGEKKMLIPAYKDMDPYNLPKEFSHLQAQDMSKLGFMQDLIRGIKKILGYDKKPTAPTVTERVVVQGDGHAQDVAPLLRRAFLFCEDGEFDNADEYAEKVLDINPECAEAYVVKLLIELELKKPSDLAECKAPISDSPNYQKAVRFATPEYRETIEGYNNAIIKRIDTARKDEVYARGVELMKLHRYDESVQYFQKIPTYKDSTQKIDDCKRLKETERLDGIYQRATQLLNAGQFDEAARLFESIEDHKDSKEKIKLCGERKENARKDAIYSQAMNRVRSQNVNDVAIKKSIEELQTISGYRDVNDQIRALNACLEKWYEDKKKAEEAARIKAEEDRRTREREAEIARIAAEKRKKKLIKTAKIGIPSVIALIVVLILLFTWIIPLIRYNQADDLLEKGELEEADKIYRDLNGFSDSEQRIALINGTQKIQKGLFDAGITEILSAGIPVKINYGMNGGDFSGVAHISMPQREEDISVKLLSASGEAGELPNENPDTVEASFTTVKDFNGVQTPERNGYYFSHWKFEKYNYELDGIFELSLSSVWSQRKYSIEYDLVGGKISGEKNLNAYYPESDAFTLVNPTRIGYTFAGWTGADLTEPTVEVTIPTGSYGNREYVATWKPNEYTINYDANGGTISSSTQTVAYDSDVEYLIPERTGYTFLGWYDGDVKVKNEKWIRTSDISLVAKWEIVGYTIGYEMNGGTNHSDNPSNYQVDTDTITLKNPSRTGYNFIGWTYEGQTTPIKDVTIEKGSVGDKTFTANWEAITTTVKFNADGGECETTSFSATYGQNITLPTVTRKGYTFLGWYNGNTKYQSGIWKTYTDIELTAKWQIISYSISYSLGGGTNASANPRTYTVEQTITLKEPTRTGYEFLGWTYEGQTTPIKTVTIPKGTIENKSYTANWKAITSTITFDANGGSCNKTTMSVTYNSSFTLPTATWDGHTFSGWYNGNTKVTSGTCKLYSNTTLVARWDIVQYNISYTMNDGTNAGANPDSYNYYDTITLADPTRTGYTFLGWTFAGQTTPTKNVTIALGTTGDKSYTANWQANTYTVMFDANGGTVSITSDDYTFDTNVTLPTPTRTGYTFGGWFVGTKQYTTGTWKTDTNVTLVAKWIGNTYKVTYSDVGTDVKVTYNFNYTGADNSVVTLKEGEVLSYPTMPIRSGYIFTGWYLDIACTKKFDFDVNISRDITLYAGWIKMNSDAVYSEIQLDPSKYNSSSNAYSISTSSTASTAKKYIYLVAQESGTHYIYWKNSSSSSYYGYYLQIKNLTTDTVIRNSSNTYSTSYNSVNFSCNKGDVIVISFYRYNTSYSSTAYFYFNKFNSPISSAKVQILDGYVNYNLGENIEYSYTFGENYNLPNVTREGYTFDGWYYNGNKVESGEWKITDNAILTANWIKNQYIITLDANGGTGVEYSQIVYYDSDFILPTPTRIGYAFGGWYYSDNQLIDRTWTFTENLSVVALWKANKYTVTYKDNVFWADVVFDYNYSGAQKVKQRLYNGDKLEYPGIPKRSGYIFTGWYIDSECVTPFDWENPKDINCNLYLYAGWVVPDNGDYIPEFLVASENSNYYKLSLSKGEIRHWYFVAKEGGEHTIYLTRDYINHGPDAILTNLTKNIEISSLSIWTNEPYKVVFTCSAGDVICLKVIQNDTFSDPAYIKFSGFQSMLEKQITTITYLENNNVEVDVVYNSDYQIYQPTREGYTFDGWYHGDARVESGKWNIAEDVVLIAKWIPNTYTVTYSSGLGMASAETQTVTMGAQIQLATASREGFEFLGWYYGDTLVESGEWAIANDVTLVAKWGLKYTVKHYLQNIDNDEYTLYETEEFVGEENASITPTVKALSGFTLPTAQTIIITKDGTLLVEYKYKRNSYKITYVTNGGTSCAATTHKYDSALNLPTPTKNGKTFGGWFTDIGLLTQFTDSNMSAGNITLYAWWQEETKAGEFTYSGSSITGYIGSQSMVVMPSHIGGTVISQIASSAFAENTIIETVIVPKTVTTIATKAFNNCTSLANIVLPTSLTSVEEQAFFGCTALKNVFYMGSETEWSNISILSNYYLTIATRYYYSETSIVGNHWHYVDGIPTPWNNEENE